MKTVYDALDPIVNGSATTKEKGDKYEAACVYYLKNDSFYALFFSRVGMIAQALEWDNSFFKGKEAVWRKKDISSGTARRRIPGRGYARSLTSSRILRETAWATRFAG